MLCGLEHTHESATDAGGGHRTLREYVSNRPFEQDEVTNLVRLLRIGVLTDSYTDVALQRIEQKNRFLAGLSL